MPWLLLVAGACSNVIGISSYEIDPALDPASGGSDVASNGGDAGLAGQGGEAGVGEANAGGGGSGAIAGEAGAAGQPPVVVHGCQSDEDCDDTIDCTVDACLPDGSCERAPSRDRCDASNCETCTAGIGCVAGPKQVKQLLVDPKLDDTTSGWTQDGGGLIVESSQAVSGSHLAQLGPAALDATEFLYGDIYQKLTIPKDCAALSLTLSFRFTPGVNNPEEEYAVLALYKLNAVNPFVEFHQFAGKDPAQPTWKQVTYEASSAEVARLAGREFTFDLLAHSFDGVYLFDNLQLDATLCQ